MIRLEDLYLMVWVGKKMVQAQPSMFDSREKKEEEAKSSYCHFNVLGAYRSFHYKQFVRIGLCFGV